MRRKNLRNALCIVTAVAMGVSSMFSAAPVRAASSETGQNVSESKAASGTEAPAQYDCIKGLADETLYDTDGNPVRACGGEVHEFTENGETKWYWFGEDVPSTTDDGTARALHLYSSTDLYNWEKEEDIFRGMVSKNQFETDDYFKSLYGDLTPEEKDIVFECLQECPTAHPKVFYNKNTNKYVMWVPGKETKLCIATSDSIKGPFKFEKYCENMSGFVMAYQESNGAVYIINRDNMLDIVISKLTDDYMDIEKTQSVKFADAVWNAGSEGAITKRNGKYYMVNSATKQYAVADSLYGTWIVHPLQMCDEDGEISEVSEMNPTSCIVPVSTDNGDVYINITEKWDNITTPQPAAEEIRYTWLPLMFSEDGTMKLGKSSNWKLDGIVHREPPVSTEDPAQYDCIKGLADETLYDTDGNPVRACGGEVHEFTENGETKWYWFGEDVPSPANYGTARSLHLYSSTDLYNWEKEEDIFRGMVSKNQFETDDYFKNLYGDLTDQEKEIVFDCLRDCPTVHPKLFYNKKTDKYVMWAARGTQMCIATSDSIKGPFKFEKYCEDMSGFMMPYQDSNGTVYIIYRNNKGAIVISKLTDDYMDIANTRSVEFADTAWEAGFEGAITQRDGKYYMVNSATKQYAVADSLYGTWEVHPLQMCDEEGETYEVSEMNPTSCILPVSTDNGDIYINITEKWDATAIQQPAPEKTRYIWQPLVFPEDGTVKLEKVSNWKLDGTVHQKPADPTEQPRYTSIAGLAEEVLYDTEGRRIHACGGEVHQIEEGGKTKWYWFGVDDLEHDSQGKNRGIHLYSSEDLYNWKYEGRMDKFDEDYMLAHPKMLYNKEREEYVMWVSGGGGTTVATSKSIKGPFVKVEGAADGISGFINLYQDRDGAAYIFYDTSNIYESGGGLSVAKLSTDYTRIEGEPQLLCYTDTNKLATAEGGVFENNGKYYIVNAGNPLQYGPQYAVADSLEGPWTVHPMRMWDDADQEFVDIVDKNQTSNVFHVKTETVDTYVCVGDNVRNVEGKSGYIWLPIKFFDDDTIALEKLSNWELDWGDSAGGEEPTQKPVETAEPTQEPVSTQEPTSQPSETEAPTQKPVETAKPTSQPVATEEPTQKPAETAKPTSQPVETAKPTQKPVETVKPTSQPVATEEPTQKPVETAKPTSQPVATEEPTQKPVATAKPTQKPVETAKPTSQPVTTAKPTQKPVETVPPTQKPVATEKPTQKPSSTGKPTQKPVATAKPTQKPVATAKPTQKPAATQEPPVKVTRVILIEKGKTLKVGDTYQIKVVVHPLNAADQTLTYTSSDKSVATVSASGKVVAKNAGKTTITVKSENGKTDRLQLTVEEGTVAAQRVLVSEKSVTMGVGEKVQLEAVVYPKNASNKKLTYRASNDKVEVNGKGKITAKKPGKCKITISLPNGKSAVVNVTVKKKPTKLSLNATKKTLKVGKKFQIKPKFPKDTVSYKVTFVSSKERVAAVSKNGKVTAKKKGNAVIVVKTYNGVRAVLKIHVK